MRAACGVILRRHLTTRAQDMRAACGVILRRPFAASFAASFYFAPLEASFSPMDQERLRRRVQGAVERAARKFSPSVRLVLSSGAALDCVASLVEEVAPSEIGAAVGLRASLVFSEEEWARVRVFCPSDSDLFDASFICDSVTWRVFVEAAPVVWEDRLGVVNVALWRPLVAR